MTVGDITDAQPWAVQIARPRRPDRRRARPPPRRAPPPPQEARAKWNAWNSRKGMSKEEAISTYIAEVDAQHAKYGDGP